MSSRHKGLQRVGSGLGKIGRIFVPKSAAVRHAREREEEERKRRQSIVRRDPRFRETAPFTTGRIVRERPKRKNPKVTKKRRRKIAHESRRRNHWQGKRAGSRR